MSLKKHILAFIVYFLFGSIGNAQFSKPENLAITIGPEIETHRKEFIDKVIGKDDEGTYVMAKYADQMTLFYYLNDLSLAKKTRFKLEYKRNELDYRGIVQMGESFFMFTTYRDKRKKETYLYSQKLNTRTLIFEEPKELAKASYDGYRRRQSASYSFTVSSDSSYLVFIADLPSDREEDEKFGLIVYDQNMEEVWSNKSIEIKLPQTNFYRYEAQVGNNGDVYVLAKVYDTSRKYKRGEINYSFQMMVYQEGINQAEVFDVSLDGAFMSDVTFERLNNGNFHVVGFYSDQGGVQNGVFNLIIDGETYEVISEQQRDFPTDFIVQHSSEKEQKKARKKEARGKEIAFYAYDIDDLIENEDGTITMIGEQYRYYQSCYTDANGNTRCTNHYIYGNIILVKFDQGGEVEWMELIPKYQHTTNDGGYYSGYAIAQIPDGSLNLVFNDNPKNSYYGQSGKFYGWRRTSSKTDIIMYSIQLDGQLNRYLLAKGTDEEVMSRPSVSVQIDANEMIILGEAKKRTKFFKLSFD